MCNQVAFESSEVLESRFTMKCRGYGVLLHESQQVEFRVFPTAAKRVDFVLIEIVISKKTDQLDRHIRHALRVIAGHLAQRVQLDIGGGAANVGVQDLQATGHQQLQKKRP